VSCRRILCWHHWSIALALHLAGAPGVIRIFCKLAYSCLPAEDQLLISQIFSSVFKHYGAPRYCIARGADNLAFRARNSPSRLGKEPKTTTSETGALCVPFFTFSMFRGQLRVLPPTNRIVTAPLHTVLLLFTLQPQPRVAPEVGHLNHAIGLVELLSTLCDDE